MFVFINKSEDFIRRIVCVLRWNSEGVRDIISGLDSGPLVLFTPAGNSVVISAFQNMMAMSTVYGTDGDVTTVSWGVFGNATRIPRDFSVWTIASYSSEGINQVYMIE